MDKYCFLCTQTDTIKWPRRDDLDSWPCVNTVYCSQLHIRISLGLVISFHNKCSFCVCLWLTEPLGFIKMEIQPKKVHTHCLQTKNNESKTNGLASSSGPVGRLGLQWEVGLVGGVRQSRWVRLAARGHHLSPGAVPSWAKSLKWSNPRGELYFQLRQEQLWVVFHT